MPIFILHINININIRDYFVRGEEEKIEDFIHKIIKSYTYKKKQHELNIKHCLKI